MTVKATIPDNTTGFIQTIFTVQLKPSFQGSDANGDFSSWAGIMGYSNMTDHPDVPGASITNIIPEPIIQQILQNQNGGSNQAVPAYFFSQGKCRDTSLGGNDAINCYPQFNETDDVAEHPFLSTNVNDPSSGLGRVYSEVYDDLQQIMYITFGVPKFNNLTSFYSGAILTQLASIMTEGGTMSASQLGQMIGETVGVAISLPVVPLVFLYNVLQGMNEVSITKYYDFKSAMPLYYRCVNSMIIHLSVNMGIVQDDFFLLGKSTLTQAGQITDEVRLETIANNAANGLGVGAEGLPQVFQKYGLDIYRILLKKYTYIDGEYPIDASTTDDALLGNFANTDTDPTAQETFHDSSAQGGASSNTVKTFAKNFFSMFEAQIYDASLYIGFKIEKGVDTSETFSNETGQSSIAQQVNSQIQSVRDSKFTFGDGNIDAAINGAIGAVTGILQGVASALPGGTTLSNVMGGTGLIDFPEVWKDSSFSKSYTFNMSLRTPYGDPISILQNLYFPLALLMAGSMPRAVGRSAYTSPFICRAYCKGMFAIPLGMITNITIKRGADQFGWSTARLPTCIDVNFEIKDLSPAMYMALGDVSTNPIQDFMNIFASNSNYQEYMMTLSGMGLLERLTQYQQLRLKASRLLGQLKTTKLSPFYWGATFGNFLPARALSTFIPQPKLPQN
jgi:hypothetical protein